MKMNDQQRLALLTTATRLGNWLTASKLPPADFIVRNRETFDALLSEVLPTPASPSRLALKPWRHWADLRPQDQARLERWVHRHLKATSAELAKRRILISAEEFKLILSRRPSDRYYLSYSIRKWAGFRVRHTGNGHGFPARQELPTNNVEDRLRIARRVALHTVISAKDTTFASNLHPDDAELIQRSEEDGGGLSVVVDKHFRKLWELLKDPSWWVSSLVEYPFAAELHLTDRSTRTEVWYAALLTFRRGDTPPTLERVFISRVWDVNISAYRITRRYKRASNALQAGLKLYGGAMARRIQPAEKEEAA